MENLGCLNASYKSKLDEVHKEERKRESTRLQEQEKEKSIQTVKTEM